MIDDRTARQARVAGFYVGLDLGQSADYSALAVIEKAGFDKDADLNCRHLQRWPLRTPYDTIVADVARLVNSDLLRRSPKTTVLAVDATGVGAPVIDMLRRSHLRAQLEPIIITGGDKVTTEGGITRVPKRELVTITQIALQNGKLRIAPLLPEAATLARELQGFQVKINLETAHDSYGAWREGAHDDLCFAAMLATWAAQGNLDKTVHVFRRT